MKTVRGDYLSESLPTPKLHSGRALHLHSVPCLLTLSNDRLSVNTKTGFYCLANELVASRGNLVWTYAHCDQFTDSAAELKRHGCKICGCLVLFQCLHNAWIHLLNLELVLLLHDSSTCLQYELQTIPTSATETGRRV